MNIKVTRAYPGEYYAVDDDTYDGPGSTIGSGPTELAAINDLVTQIVDALEIRLERTQAIKSELFQGNVWID